jgi:cellulose synthase/poly-beta-1,6-N-acetylglucosamine synthase-like glycosyltransferase
VVIATLGKQIALTRRTLEALQRQGCSKFEVVIVLNAEEPFEFEEMTRAFPVRLIQTPQRGQSLAQNLGIRQSDGEIIALTDDDVVPCDDWIHRLVAGFADAGIGCVTGRWELGSVGYLQPEKVYSERARSRWTIRPSDPNWVDEALRGDTGFAANHAFRRELLLQIGLMPEDLSGGTTVDTLEGELYLKVLHRGYALHHDPGAIVTLYFNDPPDVQKTRLRMSHAAIIALYLKLLVEDRGLRGIRWRILKSLFASARRVLRRKPEPPAPGQVRLSGMQSLAAYLYGLVLYWRSRGDTARARHRARVADRAAAVELLQGPATGSNTALGGK